MSRVVTPSTSHTQPPYTPGAGVMPNRVPHDKIAMRAYEKWCKRGCPHGTDMQDWYEAEAEITSGPNFTEKAILFGSGDEQVDVSAGAEKSCSHRDPEPSVAPPAQETLGAVDPAI